MRGCKGCRPRYHAWVEERLAELRLRLAAYKDRETQMLSADGVKQYAIGSRSLTRYDTSLKDIVDQIKAIEREIAELEAVKSGGSARRAYGVVPRDSW